ncbi:zinc finger protein 135-like isoform X2 [Uranotaenia lowii]|uniref:zinc finger protein 135-like isoform X2 n=1 Tax=Uranotaenia lowii TaxID=190385 RepID=UPI0024790494|nr:zinc finger protein 135-like isoform X2 [Uranotaenia lowii]
MKESSPNAAADMFDATDFNPDMMLSNVFLDAVGLDFMTSIEELGENMLVQDFLHFGNSLLFYPDTVDGGHAGSTSQQQQLPQVCGSIPQQQQQQSQQLQPTLSLQQSQLQLQQQQLLQVHQPPIPELQQQPKCLIDQKSMDDGHRYDPATISVKTTTTTTTVSGSDYVKQTDMSHQVVVALGSEPPKAIIPQIGQQQQQQSQQSCQCEFCEYLQANRNSLSGSGSGFGGSNSTTVGSNVGVGGDHVFQCEFCGEGFANQGSYNRHRCGSTDIQVYRCQSCRQEYGTSRTESSLNGLDGRGKCDICNKNYVQSTTNTPALVNVSVAEEEGGMVVDGTTVYGQVGPPALAEANSYSNSKISTVDSPMEHDLSHIEPFSSDSECLSELLTRVPPVMPEPIQQTNLPGKTYFILGNVEMQQMPSGGIAGSYIQNAKITSESNVTSLHQYDQYEDEDYSSMSEDEAYAKSPNQEQAKTELPIQETVIDTSSNVASSPSLSTPSISSSTSTGSQHRTEEEGKCDSSSTHPNKADRPFKCHICDRAYRNHKNLKAHIKGAHEGIRANQCEICGKNFSGSSYLVIHRRRHTGERPFKCTTCGKAFVDSRALSVHARLHTPGNRLKCMKCEKTFSSASALTVHNRLHTGVHPYKCEVCDKTFPQYNNLKHHMKKHEMPTDPQQSSTTSPLLLMMDPSSDGSSPSSISTSCSSSSSSSSSSGIGSSGSTALEYKCNVCSKPFPTSEELQSHLNQHCKDRPNQCEFCSKVFPRSSHLIIHRRRHTGERPFKCKYCEKAFVDSRALSVHTRLHTGERVTCDICLKTFASSSGLIVHRRIHLGIHPYKCDYCPKSFAQSTALKYHLKKHDTANLPTTTSISDDNSNQQQETGHLSETFSSGQSSPSTGSPEPSSQSAGAVQVQCPECNKSFRSVEYLARHRRTHSGERPFQCEICGKNFSTMSYLVIHRRRHTSERPYKCPHEECPKAFVDSRALQEHSRSVHSKIRVPCETCSKTYSSVSNLIVHRRIHSGVHPFECDTCGRSFAQKNALKYHVKQHSNNKQNDLAIPNPIIVQ